MAQPLSADGAVEFALLAQPGLQARFAELGGAEAELVRAGRLRNPVLGLGRLAGGGALEIDRSLMFDLQGLLTLPAARRAGEQQFERAQLQAARDAVGVAAAQQQAYEMQVKETADVAAELARRMVKAGNFSRLGQLRELAYYADADAQLARRQLQAQAARERLARALGWAGDPALIRR
jgi:outer membrane protein TolC